MDCKKLAEKIIRFAHFYYHDVLGHKDLDPEPFTRVIHEIAGCWEKKINGIVILRKLGRDIFIEVDIVPVLEKVAESQKKIIDELISNFL